LELYKNRLSSIPAPTYTIPNVLFPWCLIPREDLIDTSKQTGVASEDDCLQGCCTMSGLTHIQFHAMSSVE
jgi:hypothetical protein